jgi:hypothetical protein
MSDQADATTMSDRADPTRHVNPFEFLKGKPDQDVPTFKEFLAKRDEPKVHPSLQGDVPDDET